MAVIYLIRHGQASFGQENYDQLSELGLQQATRLGEVLSQRLSGFDAICLGTLTRHQQTAKNCLAGFGQAVESLELHYDAGWNEYDHQNILAQFRPEFATAESMMAFVGEQPTPKQSFERDFNSAVNRWIEGQYDQDYIETWSTFMARVQQALENTIAAHPQAKSIAVFTSGGPISLVSQALLGVEQEKIMQMNWTLMNCGVTKLVSTGSRLFLSSLNEHTHFEGALNKHYITYT